MNKFISFIEEQNINGFDKHGGTDKNSEHSYCDYYQNIFNEFDSKITILEIGTYRGGWAYTLSNVVPNHKIVAIDIEDNVSSICRNDNIDYIFKDAYCNLTIEYIKQNYNNFDVIIEDGPHNLESQIYTIVNYLPLLKKNGILIIEDIQNINYVNTLVNFVDTTKFDVNILDFRKNKNRYDDIIIEIRKL